MSSNVFVITTPVQESGSRPSSPQGAIPPSETPLGPCPGSRLFFDNSLERNGFRVFSSISEDPLTDDIREIVDYKTTTSYEFASEDVKSFTFTQNKSGSVAPFDEYSFNHVLLAGVSFANAAIVGIKISYQSWNGIEYETEEVGEFPVSGFNDRKPMVIYFDEITTSELTIEFIFNEDSGSVLDVALIYASNTYLEFESLPDVGFSPARWNNLSGPKANAPVGNAFSGVLTTQDGNEEIYNFSSASFDFANNDWRQFVRSFRFRPVFSQWNPISFPTDLIFGRMDIGRSSFNEGATARISFRIEGNI